VSVRVTVTGDREVTATLRRASLRARDYSRPLDKFGDALAAQTAEAFATDGASLGEPWKPLEPQYAGWKLKHGPDGGLLRDTGRLQESVTRRPFPIDSVGQRSAVFGTADHVARFLQHGTEDVPARPFFVVTPTLETLMRRLLADHVAGPKE